MNILKLYESIYDESSSFLNENDDTITNDIESDIDSDTSDDTESIDDDKQTTSENTDKEKQEAAAFFTEKEKIQDESQQKIKAQQLFLGETDAEDVINETDDPDFQRKFEFFFGPM